jgi:hypothetical protein
VHGLVVVTGSVYLVGQLRPRLLAGMATSVEPIKV